jgi:hypothetical protein
MKLSGISMTCVVATLVLMGSVWGRDDGGQKYHAPPDIVMTLPKFCWWFYMDNVPNTQEYNIRLTCGTYSNHYCPGLVAMKQSEKAKTTQQRSQALITAKNEMEYTIRLVKNDAYPDCTVVPTAKHNLELINFQLELLKMQRRLR